jgi:hypothetical protein
MYLLFYCGYTIVSSRSVVQFWADVVMLLINNWALRHWARSNWVSRR